MSDFVFGLSIFIVHTFNEVIRVLSGVVCRSRSINLSAGKVNTPSHGHCHIANYVAWRQSAVADVRCTSNRCICIWHDSTGLRNYCPAKTTTTPEPKQIVAILSNKSEYTPSDSRSLTRPCLRLEPVWNDVNKVTPQRHIVLTTIVCSCLIFHFKVFVKYWDIRVKIRKCGKCWHISRFYLSRDNQMLILRGLV